MEHKDSMRRDQNGAGSAASSCHLALSFEAHRSFKIPETQVLILAPFSRPDALRRRRNIIILPVFKVLQSGWGKQLYSAANAWPTRRPVSPLLLFWDGGGGRSTADYRPQSSWKIINGHMV